MVLLGCNWLDFAGVNIPTAWRFGNCILLLALQDTPGLNEFAEMGLCYLFGNQIENRWFGIPTYIEFPSSFNGGNEEDARMHEHVLRSNKGNVLG